MTDDPAERPKHDAKTETPVEATSVSEASVSLTKADRSEKSYWKFLFSAFRASGNPGPSWPWPFPWPGPKPRPPK